MKRQAVVWVVERQRRRSKGEQQWTLLGSREFSLWDRDFARLWPCDESVVH